MDNFYDALRIPFDASDMDIAAAHDAASLRVSTDHTLPEAVRRSFLAQLGTAFDTLTDPARRATYDTALHQELIADALREAEAITRGSGIRSPDMGKERAHFDADFLARHDATLSALITAHRGNRSALNSEHSKRQTELGLERDQTLHAIREDRERWAQQLQTACVEQITGLQKTRDQRLAELAGEGWQQTDAASSRVDAAVFAAASETAATVTQQYRQQVDALQEELSSNLQLLRTTYGDRLKAARQDHAEKAKVLDDAHQAARETTNTAFNTKLKGARDNLATQRAALTRQPSRAATPTAPKHTM